MRTPAPVPGQPDVWNHVTRFDDRPAPSAPDLTDDAAAPTPSGRRRHVRLIALGTALVLLGGGSLAVASAHKTVTLDVDGRLTEISTFAGSIDGLLEDEGVELRDRDLVAPSLQEPLRDGGEVVVRHARQVTVLSDGEESTVWTTALSAEEALTDLSARGADVSLVASRSGATGRADLAVRLGDGPVAVVVDGTTHEVTDASAGLDEVLAGLGLTLGILDRVRVGRTEGGPVTVTVHRVVAEEQTALSEVPFERVVEQTDALYTGQSETAQAGAVGERAIVHRVVLVDGVEESRMLLSDQVTRLPVTEVVREGTKARPAPKPRPAPAPATSTGTGGGGGAVVGGDVWAALAQCESGGNPTIVSSNGLYHGLYQFSVGTWESVGGTGLPSQASPAEQTERAQILQARSGWGQWPACSLKLGLR